MGLLMLMPLPDAASRKIMTRRNEKGPTRMNRSMKQKAMISRVAQGSFAVSWCSSHEMMMLSILDRNAFKGRTGCLLVAGNQLINRGGRLHPSRRSVETRRRRRRKTAQRPCTPQLGSWLHPTGHGKEKRRRKAAKTERDGRE